MHVLSQKCKKKEKWGKHTLDYHRTHQTQNKVSPQCEYFQILAHHVSTQLCPDYSCSTSISGEHAASENSQNQSLKQKRVRCMVLEIGTFDLDFKCKSRGAHWCTCVPSNTQLQLALGWESQQPRTWPCWGRENICKHCFCTKSHTFSSDTSDRACSTQLRHCARVGLGFEPQILLLQRGQ